MVDLAAQETALRFSSQSIGAVERAQDAVEGQIRCLRLELETRLPLEVTPAMDVWPWLVGDAGWLLDRFHVKGKKERSKTVLGKPNQGEVMKFAEAALFRVTVSPGGRIRDGIRQGRADARFVRGGSARPRTPMNLSSRRTQECTPRGQLNEFQRQSKDVQKW